jgi:carbamoylphosphate synthase large subunit
LILGAGPAQFDAIRYCKQKGYCVHVCSSRIGFEVLQYVDKVQIIDIRDNDAIEKYAAVNNIDFIYSVGSSLALITASTVSKRLGLKYFVEPEIAMLCHNKYSMRQHLGCSHSSNVRCKHISNIDDTLDWNIFPSIIKPVDSQGQRGVYLINNKEDIRKYFGLSMEFSYLKRIILCEYIDGPEISVNVYIKNGKIVFHQISERIALENYPGWKPKRHIINGLFPDDENRLIGVVTEILNKFKITDGPVYFQFKYQDQIPKLIEFMPRLDGCHLWRLIELSTGINLLEYTFDDLITGILPSNGRITNENYLAINFVYDTPMQYFSLGNYEKMNSFFNEWYFNEGDFIEQTNGSCEKVGYFITNSSGYAK